MNNLLKLEKKAYLSFKPPKKLSLSQWADNYAYLSAESSAEGGRWRTLPYQKGIMDAITDPNVEQVTLMKSARVGYSKILNLFTHMKVRLVLDGFIVNTLLLVIFSSVVWT